jgi:hypothetical protein
VLFQSHISITWRGLKKRCKIYGHVNFQKRIYLLHTFSFDRSTVSKFRTTTTLKWVNIWIEIVGLISNAKMIFRPQAVRSHVHITLFLAESILNVWLVLFLAYQLKVNIWHPPYRKLNWVPPDHPFLYLLCHCLCKRWHRGQDKSGISNASAGVPQLWQRPWHIIAKKKGKAVPLHAMEAFGGRGGIAPTHSRPRHYIGVSGQRHAPAAL